MKQSSPVLFLGSFLLVFIVYGCKKIDFKNPLNKNYTVSGSVYYDEHLVPIAGVDLILYTKNLNSGSGKSKVVDFATTNVLGQYVFDYNRDKNLSDMFIVQDFKSNPVNFYMGQMLGAIPQNEDIVQDLYKDPFGYARFKIIDNGKLKTGDTLYIGGFDTDFNAYYNQNIAGTSTTGLRLIYPFGNNVNGVIEIGPFKLPIVQRYNLPTVVPIYFGVGSLGYQNSFNGNESQQSSAAILGHPVLTTVRIEL